MENPYLNLIDSGAVVKGQNSYLGLTNTPYVKQNYKLPEANFGDSVGSALIETIGAKPDAAVEEWRKKHPWQSFGSQIIGNIPWILAVPTGATEAAVGTRIGLTAGKVALGAEKVLSQRIGSELASNVVKSSAPFLTGAAEGMGRAAVFEGARQLALPITKPILDDMGYDTKSFSEDAANSLMSIGLGGLMGGGIKWAEHQSWMQPKIDNLAPVSRNDTLSSRVQILRSTLDSGKLTPENAIRVQNELDNTVNKFFAGKEVKYADDGRLTIDAAPQNRRIFLKPVDGELDPQVEKEANFYSKLFTPNTKTKRWSTKTLDTSATGFQSPAEVTQIFDAIGKTREEIAANSEFAGVIHFDKPQQATIGETPKNLQQRWMTEEASNQDSSVVDMLKSVGVEAPLEKGNLNNVDVNASRILTPRPVESFKPKNPAGSLANRLEKDFTTLENGMKVKRFEDGSWAVLQQVEEGTPYIPNSKSKAKVGQAYAYFITKDPAWIAPEATKIIEASAKSPSMDFVGKAIHDLKDNITYTKDDVEYEVGAWKQTKQILAAFEESVRTGQKYSLQTQNKWLAGAERLFKNTGLMLAPAVHAASESPAYKAIYRMGLNLMQNAEMERQKLLTGLNFRFGGEDSAASTIWKSQREREGGLLHHFKNIIGDDEATVMRDVEIMRELEMTPEKLDEIEGHFASTGREPIFDKRAVEIYNAVTDVADSKFAEMMAVKKAVGSSGIGSLVDVDYRKGHFLQRRRKGAEKYIVEDLDGKFVDVLGADNYKHAQELINAYNTKNAEELVLGSKVSQLDFNPENLRTLMRSRGRAMKQSRTSGSITFTNNFNNLTLDGLLTDLQSHLIVRDDAINAAILKHFSQPLLMKLSRQDEVLANSANGFIDRVAKVPDSWTKALDETAGKLGWTNGFTDLTRALNTFTSTWSQGFANLAAGAQNAIGFFANTFPEGQMIIGSPKGLEKLYHLVPAFDEQGRMVNWFSHLSPTKLLNQTMKKMFEPTADVRYQTFLNDLADRGKIEPRFVEEQFSLGVDLRDLRGHMKDLKSAAKYIAALGDIGLTKTEEFTRIGNATMAYQLFMENPALIQHYGADRVRELAFEFLDRTSINYDKFARSQIFQNPVGGLLGNMKNWAYHMLGNQLAYAGLGKDGIAPLLTGIGFTAGFGGLAATPFKPLLEAYYKNKSEHDFENGLHEDFDTTGADMIAYGLPSLFGLSLTSMLTGTGADPARDASMLTSFVFVDRAKVAGKAAGTGWQDLLNAGINPLNDALFRDQMSRAFLPRTIYKAIAAGEDNSIRSLQTGYRVMDDVSLGSAVLYAAGFNPVELDKRYAVYQELRNDEKAKQEQLKLYGKLIADSNIAQDYDASTHYLEQAMQEGFDVSKVLKSASARQEARTTPQVEMKLGDSTDNNWARDIVE